MLLAVVGILLIILAWPVLGETWRNRFPQLRGEPQNLGVEPLHRCLHRDLELRGCCDTGSIQQVPDRGELYPRIMRVKRQLNKLRRYRVGGFEQPALSRLPHDGTVRPILDSTFPLEDVAAAYAHARSGRATGKVAVTIR